MPECDPLQSMLTFEMLDDVLFQPENEQDGTLAGATIFQIGPLVELAYTSPQRLKNLIAKQDTFETRALSKILNATPISYGKGNVSTSPSKVEFFCPPQTNEEFEREEWIAFELRLENAGKKAGLPAIFAKELTGTFGEMVSNLFDHSERPDTGIVGYRWGEKEFEYIVADQGIGMLNSLRQHQDYADLIDAEDALLTALREGESRYGREAKRGRGFKTLILNIAGRSSCLRFRTGDRSHVIDGMSAKPTRTSFTCVHYQGFLISVSCLSDANP